MEKSLSPAYLPAEDAAVPKKCRFCGEFMEIKQINLTVAVRQCYRELDVTDIEFFHRSYQDKNRNPSEWSRMVTSEEEELRNLRSWVDQLNITCSDDEENGDDDDGRSVCLIRDVKAEPALPLKHEHHGWNVDDFVDGFQQDIGSSNQEACNAWANSELDELDAVLEKVSCSKSENFEALPFSPHDLLFGQSHVTGALQAESEINPSKTDFNSELPDRNGPSKSFAYQGAKDRLKEEVKDTTQVATSSSDEAEKSETCISKTTMCSPQRTGEEVKGCQDVTNIATCAKDIEDEWETITEVNDGTMNKQSTPILPPASVSSFFEDVCKISETDVNSNDTNGSSTVNLVETEMISAGSMTPKYGTVITYAPRSMNSASLQSKIKRGNSDHGGLHHYGKCVSEIHSPQVQSTSEQEDNGSECETDIPAFGAEPCEKFRSHCAVSSAETSQLSSFVHSQQNLVVICDCKDDDLQAPIPTRNDTTCVDLKLPDLSLSNLKGETIKEVCEGTYDFPTDLDRVLFSPVPAKPKIKSDRIAQRNVTCNYVPQQTDSTFEPTGSSPQVLDISANSFVVTIPADVDITSEMLQSVSLADIPVFFEKSEGIFLPAPSEEKQSVNSLSTNECINNLQIVEIKCDDPEDSVMLDMSNDGLLLQPVEINADKNLEDCYVENTPAINFIIQPLSSGELLETNVTCPPTSLHAQSSCLNMESLVSNEQSEDLGRLSNICVDQPLQLPGILREEDDEELKAFTGAKFKPIANRKLPKNVYWDSRQLNLLGAMRRDIEEKTTGRKVTNGNTS